MKKWPHLLIAAAEALLVLTAVYFEPTHCVRGWLWGEAFFEGRPTSYWADEIERWDYTCTICEEEQYVRRSPWPRFVQGYLPEPDARWPRLFDGDADGLPVLQELRTHPSVKVRDWARIGIARIGNAERGPIKGVARLHLRAP